MLLHQLPSTSIGAGAQSSGLLRAHLACEPDNYVRLHAAGAGIAAVTAMKLREDDERIAGCGVLLKLAAVDELREPLEQLEDVPAQLLAALRRHGRDARVARAAAAAIVQLSAAECNRAALVAAGALKDLDEAVCTRQASLQPDAERLLLRSAGQPKKVALF